MNLSSNPEPPPGRLEVTSVRDGEALRLELSGELDLSTAETLEAELVAAEESDADGIVVDLRGLRFMDSSGLRVLLTADARCRVDGDGPSRLRFVRGEDRVQRVFELTGMDERLQFED